jgi:oligoribonuclease
MVLLIPCAAMAFLRGQRSRLQGPFWPAARRPGPPATRRGGPATRLRRSRGARVALGSAILRAVSPRTTRLFWIDLEMTGLDAERCAIVEIASLITDGDLSIVAEGPCLVIHQPEEVLEGMDDFVRQMHARSGLTERIRKSEVTLEQAEAETFAFLREHVDPKSTPLCGNSVWKDREFLSRYMPSVTNHLHYRIIDVSTIKELVRRWYPAGRHAPKKQEAHRALDDIRESIEELRFYRKSVFAP